VSWSLAERSLYLCTPVREDLEAFVAGCVEGGVDVVQLRDRAHDDRTLLDAAERLAATCAALGVPFVVNDRCDVALAVGADGVHVGQEDLPAARCRALLGDDAIIGLSTHEPAQLEAALAEPVSYVSAGPVVATPTKPGRAGTGTEFVALAARRASIPVFVTGGVTAAAIPGLVALGVRHFVVVRALTEAREPRDAARRLKAAIRDAVEAAAGGAATDGRR
jgi:thiamine-phosphate pyrophosphorylase